MRNNKEEAERSFVFLYKTNDYSGQLLKETEEGRIFWMDLEKFLTSQLAPNMDVYMELFLKEDIGEAYATWRGKEESEILLF